MGASHATTLARRYRAFEVNVNAPGVASLPELGLRGDHSNSKEALSMAENTDWFQQATTEEAKQDRIIFGVWAARLGILLTLLCVVAYATMA